jgi:hypothetical protein
VCGDERVVERAGGRLHVGPAGPDLCMEPLQLGGRLQRVSHRALPGGAEPRSGLGG